MKAHKSGFVNIVGNPNVGKSTLMNALVGEKMSIITSKPQTTRHRILGLLNDDDYQIVFSDTPGIIDKPLYGMQSAMNKFAWSSFEDADVVLFVTDIYEKYTGEENVIKVLNETTKPKYLIINKIDLDVLKISDSISVEWNKIVSLTRYFLFRLLKKQILNHCLVKYLMICQKALRITLKMNYLTSPKGFSHLRLSAKN